MVKTNFRKKNIKNVVNMEIFFKLARNPILKNEKQKLKVTKGNFKWDFKKLAGNKKKKENYSFGKYCILNIQSSFNIIWHFLLLLNHKVTCPPYIFFFQRFLVVGRNYKLSKVFYGSGGKMFIERPLNGILSTFLETKNGLGPFTYI